MVFFLFSREHLGAVLCLTMTSDDDIIISGSDDTTIVVFSVMNGKRIDVMKGHTKAVTALKLNSNADLLASGKLWSTWSMNKKFQLSNDLVLQHLNKKKNMETLEARTKKINYWIKW